MPLINKGPDLLGGSSSANFLRERRDLLQKTFLPLTALYKWLEHDLKNRSEILDEDQKKLCSENQALMFKINNFTAFEAMQNVIPKDRLNQLFTACRDLDKERKGLYQEIEAPSSTVWPLFFESLFSYFPCYKK